MTSTQKRTYRPVLLITATLFFTLYLFPASDLEHVSNSTRRGYLRQARIWQKTDIPAMDILAGPQNEISAPPESDVQCRYEPTTDPVAGASPKFTCRLLTNDTVIRVKYHRRETFGEVAATRLLWALGFYTDETYPVRIVCFDCPQMYEAQPLEPGRKKIIIEDGIMERKFPGKSIQVFNDQGWKWYELNEVNEKLGGATKAEVDALKLLAVFLQHSDSKHQQQRLGCYFKDIDRRGNLETCRKPVLMIQDVGATFGVGGPQVTKDSSMYLRGWIGIDVWNKIKEDAYSRKNPGQIACFGNLMASEKEGLFDPQISEDGRQFLAALLNQLTDPQIYDLFLVSRANLTGETIEEFGAQRLVTIEDWVAAFKIKRQQINDKKCS